MIELKGVTKQYLYGARILGATDMIIKDGEIVALLGDEGSGRTTFIKVASAVTDCEGEVLLDGTPVKTKTDDVAVVFDDLAVFGNRTFYYNLAYPLKIRGYEKSEIDSRVKAAAERLGITACLYERVKKMPLIDVKRLAIARLLIRDVKAIFIDDITSGLCQKDARALWSEVAPIILQKAKEGKTVVFSTSVREEAMSVADRIAVMHYGEIKQIDAASRIESAPDNVWAAQAFDVHYHFERAELTRDGEGLKLIFGIADPVSEEERTYTLDASCFDGMIADGYEGKTVIVGWRCDCFAKDGDRTERVKYALYENGAYLLYTESGIVVSSEQKQDTVCTLPVVEKARLYDFTNENSIHKRER